MKAVVIIPTYNEKGNIERLINILEKDIFPGIKGHEMAILVADDTSPDGTSQEVKELSEKPRSLASEFTKPLVRATEKLEEKVEPVKKKRKK